MSYRYQAIVWDRSLFGPFRLITKLAALADANVVATQFLNGQPLPELPGVRHIVFICRPRLALMDAVAAIVHAEEQRHKKSTAAGRQPRNQPPPSSTQPSDVQFHLVCVPRITRQCTDQLVLGGVLGSLTLHALPCELFPLDADVLSLELPHMFREIYVDGDTAGLYACASALSALQTQFGRVARVYGKGQCAQTVWQLCKTMQLDAAGAVERSDGCGGRNAAAHRSAGAAAAGGAIDQLIILDRSIDLMSVLATQLTYEGLIDELVGVRQCVAKFPADVFRNSAEAAGGHLAGPSTSTATTATTSTKEVVLNSADDIHAELRDKHVHAVGAALAAHAKSVAAQLTIKADKSVQEIKQIVTNMPRLLARKEAVARHTAIAVHVMQHTESRAFLDQLACEQDFLLCENADRASAFVEDAMARAAPLRAVLRLMCMQCQAANGLKPKVLEYYKRELVQVYGVKVLLTLANLQRAGLLRVQQGVRTYAMLRKTLQLTVEVVNEQQPRDLGYVHGSYAPLSVRVVERSLRRLGWLGMGDVLASLPGPTFQETTAVAADKAAADEPTSTSERRSSLSSELSLADHPRVVMVFFVGGCTFAEVAALRFVAQEAGNVEIVVGTTRMLNKNTFLDDLIEGY